MGIRFRRLKDCDEVADNWVGWFRCMVQLRSDRIDFVRLRQGGVDALSSGSLLT